MNIKKREVEKGIGLFISLCYISKYSLTRKVVTLPCTLWRRTDRICNMFISQKMIHRCPTDLVCMSFVYECSYGKPSYNGKGKNSSPRKTFSCFQFLVKSACKQKQVRAVVGPLINPSPTWQPVPHFKNNYIFISFEKTKKMK